MGHKAGDKVRSKVDGRRGVLRAIRAGRVDVLLGTQVVDLDAAMITNYSLAARRAWATRPKRSGRPRLASPRKRMISLRIDVDLLASIAVLAEKGAIPSREAAINDWIRYGIARSGHKTQMPPRIFEATR